MILWFLLFLGVGAGRCVLCPQLQSRSITRTQAFQLPLYKRDSVDDLIELIQRLQSPPYELSVGVRDGWFEVDIPQPYCQEELERAFRCI